MSLTNTANIEVLYDDGKKETIVLKEKLSIRELYLFCRYTSAEDTYKIVALCCGKGEEWIDNLDFDCYLDLAQRCVKANFQRAMELMKKDQNVAASMAPFLAKARNAMGALSSEEMKAAVEIARNMNLGNNGTPSSQEPAPSASPEETTNESSITPPTGSSPSSAPPSA